LLKDCILTYIQYVGNLAWRLFTRS